MELLGNFILSRLLITVIESFNEKIVISQAFVWRDSKVTLAFIKAPKRELQTCAPNRFIEITKKVSPENGVIVQSKVILRI